MRRVAAFRTEQCGAPLEDCATPRGGAILDVYTPYVNADGSRQQEMRRGNAAPSFEIYRPPLALAALGPALSAARVDPGSSLRAG